MNVGVQMPIYPKEFRFSDLDTQSVPFFYLERDSCLAMTMLSGFVM